MYLKHACCSDHNFFHESEIYVFGDNVLFCNRNSSIVFVWEEAYGFLQIKRKNR